MQDELKDKILNSGTSILGIVCKDGVVMAADRQVTAGNLVVSKNFKKVNQINDYIVISWTGGVADAQLSSKVLTAELKLKELRSKQRPTVKDTANLVATMTYRNIRQFASIPSIVGTIIAGVNEDGTAELFSIEPAGSVVKVEDYDANFGSGMPYILGFMERQYKKDLTVKEGIQLAIEALKSSTQRDTGSGYGIDIFALTKEGIKQVVEQTIEPSFKEDK